MTRALSSLDYFKRESWRGPLIVLNYLITGPLVFCNQVFLDDNCAKPIKQKSSAMSLV